MITKQAFKLPLYGVPYEIYVVDTMEEAKSLYPEFGDCFAAMVVCEDDYTKLWMIIRNDVATLAVTAHESVHLANKICLFLGIKADADNDEPLAYMVEHIFGTAIKVQELHKISRYEE